MKENTFGNRLRELREQAGVTQHKLADDAGLTREGVAQLEVGRRKPAWNTVLLLARALGTDANAFMHAPAAKKSPGPGRPKTKARKKESSR